MHGPAIALCVRGAAELDGKVGSFELERGRAAYVTADESPLGLTGDGLVFVATTG